MGALAARITDLDRRWLLEVARRRAPAWLDRAFRLVTHLGGAIFTIALGFLLLATEPTRALGAAVLLANAVSHVAVQLVKRTVTRPRPHFPEDGVEALVAHPDAFSLPSGHSCASLTVALTVALWTPNPIVQLGVLALAVLVGTSRVYLRVHYVTDVLVGQAIGVAGAVVTSSVLG